MAWTDITFYPVRKRAAEADMDTLKANIEYLHQQNSYVYHHPGTGSNLSVSGTLGVDIGGGFAGTIVTHGGPVTAIMTGIWRVVGANDNARMSIIRDVSASVSARNLFYNWDIDAQTTLASGEGKAWKKSFPDVPAGTHVFRVIWGVDNGSGGGTAQLLVAPRPYFAAWEG